MGTPDDDMETPPCDGAIWLPDPRGPLGALSRLEQRWKYGPQLYWYVTRGLWWARWRIWSWRYWHAPQDTGETTATEGK